jgi:hypothetical protein
MVAAEHGSAPESWVEVNVNTNAVMQMVAHSEERQIGLYDLFCHVAEQGDEFATVEVLIIHEPIARTINIAHKLRNQPYNPF